MNILEDRIVDHLLHHCPARTDEALMERFGISYNTFRKIERRQPIRVSVADRLRARLATEKE